MRAMQTRPRAAWGRWAQRFSLSIHSPFPDVLHLDLSPLIYLSPPFPLPLMQICVWCFAYMLNLEQGGTEVGRCFWFLISENLFDVFYIYRDGCLTHPSLKRSFSTSGFVTASIYDD
jgi:hypothetical protein